MVDLWILLVVVMLMQTTITTNLYAASAITAEAVFVSPTDLKGNNFINLGDLLGVATN